MVIIKMNKQRVFVTKQDELDYRESQSKLEKREKKLENKKFSKRFMNESHPSPYSTKTIKKSFKGKRFWI